MRRRARATSLLLLVVLVVFAGAAAHAADPDRPNRVMLAAKVSSWPGLEDLDPQPVDFIAEEARGFEPVGYGFEIRYQRRLGGEPSRWCVGGEFAGYAHDNQGSFLGTNAITGETSRITLQASWGHLTGSFRRLWRPSRMPEISLGAGAGLYLIRIQESIEGFGVADRDESDTALGGFLAAGLRFPVSQRWGIAL